MTKARKNIELADVPKENTEISDITRAKVPIKTEFRRTVKAGAVTDRFFRETISPPKKHHRVFKENKHRKHGTLLISDWNGALYIKNLALRDIL